MQRDELRDRSWRGRDDEDLELWGRDMDREDWMRGTYGSDSGWTRSGGGRGWRGGSDWQRGPGYRGHRPDWSRGRGWRRPADWQPAEWQAPGERMYQSEPWRGDRDWSHEWWHQRRGPWGHDAASDWSGGGHWHGRTMARGYQRSDERIREDVYERLMEHPGIDTSDIDVTVSHGEVTLEGTVDDRWEKRLAEDLAESVSGVSDVHNRLRFMRPMSMPSGGDVSAATGPTMRSTAPMTDASPTGSGWAPGPGATPPTAGQTIGRTPMRQGMSVLGADGERIGQVKDMRGEELLIARPMGRDVFAPMRYIQNVVSEQIVLSIPARQVDSMGWRTAELLTSPPTPNGS
jgi:hypothetical protein